MYNGGSWVRVASASLTIIDSKYSTSRNPSTGLFYRLHILNVAVSDLKKYRCSGLEVVTKYFYLELILLGRYNYILTIFMVENIYLLVALTFLLKLYILFC